MRSGLHCVQTGRRGPSGSCVWLWLSGLIVRAGCRDRRWCAQDNVGGLSVSVALGLRLASVQRSLHLSPSASFIIIHTFLHHGLLNYGNILTNADKVDFFLLCNTPLKSTCLIFLCTIVSLYWHIIIQALNLWNELLLLFCVPTLWSKCCLETILKHMLMPCFCFLPCQIFNWNFLKSVESNSQVIRCIYWCFGLCSQFKLTTQSIRFSWH